MGILSDIYKGGRITPGAWIAAWFFGLFVTLVVIFVGWFLFTSPTKTELHTVDGQTYVCRYYHDDIRCNLWNDSHAGGGRVTP